MERLEIMSYLSLNLCSLQNPTGIFQFIPELDLPPFPIPPQTFP
jgi:hypothetical protein